MARFDVHKFHHPTAKYVLDIQCDLLSDLDTRIIIPLLPESDTEKENHCLNPVVVIRNQSYVLLPAEMTSISKEMLGEIVDNVEQERYTIMNAIDFLFQGF